MTTTIRFSLPAAQDADACRPKWLAPQSVSCPKCHARPGRSCTSTGGGNYAEVAFHRARRDRIAGWTTDQLVDAHDLVVGNRPGYGRWAGLDIPAGTYTATEAAAAPVVEKATKPVTPKGVRLSEAQAEEIERFVHSGGFGHVSTAHFHGEAQHRQTVNALEAKGILRFVELTEDHYDRLMALTPFGWQVYRQHRLIIHRLSEAEVDALEAASQRADVPAEVAA